MKKTFLFVSAVIVASAAHAQHGYGYSAATNMNFVPNGFRSVAEENALMERVVAERRRQAAKEEGIPYVEPKYEYNPQPRPAAAVATANTAKPKHTARKAR